MSHAACVPTDQNLCTILFAADVKRYHIFFLCSFIPSFIFVLSVNLCLFGFPCFFIQES